ncbi:MAG: hypothetical protein U0269_35270 [Polyangiales bacterium]
MEFFSVGAQARGFIAIGAEAEGVIALGQVSRGVIAIGQMATGVIAIGQLARGVFTIGQLGVGVWAYGQGGLGVLRAVGMIAVAARAGGMLPLSILPERKEQWKPGRESTIEELEQGAVNEGWVRGSLALDGDRVTVTAGNNALEGCEVAPSLTSAARAESKREGWLYIERREQLEGAEEGGFREAPTRTVKLAVVNAQWPKRVPTGRLVVAAIGMLVVISAVSAISLYPVAELLVGLVTR